MSSSKKQGLSNHSFGRFHCNSSAGGNREFGGSPFQYIQNAPPFYISGPKSGSLKSPMDVSNSSMHLFKAAISELRIVV